MLAARRIPGAPTRPHGWYQAEHSRELAGFFLVYCLVGAGWLTHRHSYIAAG